MSSDDQLPSVLPALIPRLLRAIGNPDNTQATRNGLAQVLSDALTRIRSSAIVDSPALEVLGVLKGPSVPLFTLNFALPFLEVAPLRTPLEDTLPVLLKLLEVHPDNASIAHTILSYLPSIKVLSSLPSLSPINASGTFKHGRLFDLLVDVFAYIPPSTAPVPGEAAFGLSSKSTTRLLSKRPEVATSNRALAALKLSALPLVTPTKLDVYRSSPSLAVALLVLASADVDQAVSLPAADALKAALDSRSCRIDPQLLLKTLLHMTVGDSGLNVKPSPDSRRALSSRQVAIVLSFCANLVRDTTDIFASGPAVLTSLSASAGTKALKSSDSKAQVSGASLLSALSSRLLSPSPIHTLLRKSLASTALSSLSTIATPPATREHMYTIIATLSRLTTQYSPSIESSDLTLPALLFSMLPKEAPELATKLTSTLDSLLLRYTKTAHDPVPLLPLLWSAATSTARPARSTASRWAAALIPGSRGSHILVYLAGDPDPQIATSARNGLKDISAPFADLVTTLLIPGGHPTFDDFNLASKSAVVKALICAFDPVSSPVDSVLSLVGKISNTIQQNSSSRDPAMSSLIDDCASALSRILPHCAEAHGVLTGLLSLSSIYQLCVTAPSSLTRTSLSSCFSSLNPPVSIMSEALSLANSKLTPSTSSSFAHGASHLAGAILSLSLHSPAPELVALISEAITSLGTNSGHSDPYIANAASISLSVALSINFDAELFSESIISLINSLAKTVLSAEDPTRIVPLSSATAAALAIRGPVFSTPKLALSCALFKLLPGAAYKAEPEVALAIGSALASIFASTIEETQTPVPSTPYDEDNAQALPLPTYVLYRTMRSTCLAHQPHTRTSGTILLLTLTATNAPIIGSNIQEIQGLFVKSLSDPKSKHLSRECACLGLATCRGLTKSTATSDESHRRVLVAFGQTTNHGGSLMMETREQEAERHAANTGNSAVNGSRSSAPTEGGAAGISEAALGAYREMANAAAAVDGDPDLLYYLICLSATHTVWSTEPYKSNYAASKLLKNPNLTMEDLRTSLAPHLKKLIPKLLRASNDPNPETRSQMISLWESIMGGKAEGRSVITSHLNYTIDELCTDATNKFWRARVGGCGALSDVIVGRSFAELGGGPAIVDEDNPDHSAHTAARLLRLWRVTVRALDDVRGNVREAGMTLAQSIRSLTCRLCDPTTSGITAEESEAATSTTLTWLIKHGLNQPCDEATALCIATLLGVVEVAKASTLQPILPKLINNLICAMSGLEPSALNYLQLRMGGGETGERLEDLRIRMATNGPIGVALTKCVDLIKFADIGTKKEVVRELDAALRNCVGAVSRAAVADVVNQLSTTAPEAFQSFNVSSSSSTVRLLRGLYFASEKERGIAARDKLTFALGNLASLAPEGSVRVLVKKLCENYDRASGSNGSLSGRRAAAGCLAAIASRSSNVFSGRFFGSRVLPMAFVGQLGDPDETVSKSWKVVWEEGGGAYGSARVIDESKFGVRLEEKLLQDICEIIKISLSDVSWMRRKGACAAVSKLCDAGLFNPCDNTDRCERRRRCVSALFVELINCVKGRVWNGKLKLLEAVAGLICTGIMTFQDEKVGNLIIEVAEGEEKEEIVESEMEVDDGNEVDGKIEIEDDVEDGEDVMDEVEREIQTEQELSISWRGICSLFYGQSLIKSTAVFALPYKVASLVSLTKVLEKVGEDKLKELHEELSSGIEYEGVEPVIIAKRVGVFGGLVYEGMGDCASVCRTLEGLSRHEAWTVREASCHALSRLAAKGIVDRVCVEIIAGVFKRSMDDRKYAKCRMASLQMLKALLEAVKRNGRKELGSVWLEDWSAVVRRALKDTDVGVTGQASSLMVILSSW